jgi:hypothetical protein
MFHNKKPRSSGVFYYYLISFSIFDFVIKSMMKHLFIFLSVLALHKAAAQDIITLVRGGNIQAKVQEVKSKEIVYKKFSNPNGPNYYIDIEDVEKINYEGGTVDIFEANPNAGTPFSYNSKGSSKDFGDNIISINIPDILFQNITFSYERIVGKQKKLGLRVPMSVSLYGDNNNNLNFNSYNIFYSGIDFNYYPTGQGQARLFLGPVLRTGYARVRSEMYDEFLMYFTNSTVNTGYFSFMLQGGFIFTPVKELIISSSFGVGSRRYFTAAPNNGNLAQPTATFHFSVGYRF